MDRSREDHFTLFGVKRAFAQDAKELERRFYGLSRALHPDRFSTAPAPARAASVERMGLLNQAYGVLKDPRARREYLLALEGVKLPEGSTVGSAQIPMELAEEWFEVQEALMESGPDAAPRLRDFRTRLETFRSELAAAIADLEARYDAAGPGSVERTRALETLGQKIQVENYLASLERTIGRWVK